MPMPIEEQPEVHGGCYCGEVRFSIVRNATPLLSGYCHCLACRQAHAAPMYAVAWLPHSEFRITQGQERLKWYTRSESAREHLRRYFCSNCGTKVFNSYNGPFGEHQISVTGAFPSLFDDQSVPKSNKWAPTVHMHCEEAIINLSQLNDGLPKLPKAAT